MNTHLSNFKALAVCVFCLLAVFANSCFAQFSASVDSPLTLVQTSTTCAPSPVSPPSVPWQGSELNKAAINLNVVQVKKLLATQPNVNEPDSLGNTPLYNTVAQRIAEPTRKPRATVLRENQKTAKAQIAIARMLLKAGADPTIKGINAKTVLSEAVKMDDSVVLEMLVLLLNSRADINSQDSQGYTALMEAARTNRIKVVSFLSKNGANRNSQNCNNQTALAIAQQLNFSKTAALLQP